MLDLNEISPPALQTLGAQAVALSNYALLRLARWIDLVFCAGWHMLTRGGNDEWQGYFLEPRGAARIWVPGPSSVLWYASLAELETSSDIFVAKGVPACIKHWAVG